MCLLTVSVTRKCPNSAKIFKNCVLSKHEHIRNIQYPFEGGWGFFVFHKYFLVFNKISEKKTRKGDSWWHLFHCCVIFFPSFRKKGFNVKSYGSGNYVKLPGSAPDKPNIYDFNTTYDDMYKDLVKKDKSLYPLKFKTAYGKIQLKAYLSIGKTTWGIQQHSSLSICNTLYYICGQSHICATNHSKKCCFSEILINYLPIRI